MLHFSIRDVLWLTVVAAVLLAWWLDRNRIWRDCEHNRNLVASFKAIGMELEPLLKQLVGSTPPNIAPKVVRVRVNQPTPRPQTYPLELIPSRLNKR